MDKIFLTILNMSLTGAFVIAAICLARLPLKKAPKIISYCLWVVAGFRLVFPFSIESIFSLIPFNAAPIPTDIATQPIPRIESGIPFVNNAVSGALPAATVGDNVNPLQIWTFIGSWAWIVGVAVMFMYGVISYILLKRKMNTAVRVENNIYETDEIQSPFVLSIVRPKIYIPLGLSGTERDYILLHEQTHIKRRDHIVKFAAYFILCLHWFNPLAWAAFLLMGVDMEMSCDERVLKEMGADTKKDYSMSLLSLTSNRRFIGGSPLAFSEGGLKSRIKNALNFKKPSRIIVVTAVALVAVLSVGFALNREDTGERFGIKTFNLQNISSIELTSGMNGTVVFITDTDEIEKLIQSFNEHEFLRDSRSDIFTGWSYRLRFYRNGKTQEEIIIMNDNTIKSNNRFYMNGKGAINLKQYEDLLDNPQIVNNNFTLDDIRALAAKGDDLQFSDFPNIRPSFLSSTMGGYNPTLYGVEGGYRLLINFNDTLNPEKGISSTSLESIWGNGGSGIDIRYSDVDEFIRANPSHPAIIGLEAEIIARTFSGKSVTYIDTEWWEFADEFPHHSKDPAKHIMWETLENIGQTCELFIDADGVFIAVGRRNGAVYTYDNGVWRAFTGAREWSSATKNMTLNDVRAIAQKIETDLTMSDFQDFIGKDVGSGIFIMQYFIYNSDYMLLVGSSDMKTVQYAYLEYAANGGENKSIDIRYYDIDKFIANGTRELMRPLPEDPIPDAETPPSYNTAQSELNGLSMNILDITPDGLSFYFEHMSNGEPINGERFIYGEHFLLYVQKNSEWVIAEPIIENWDWIFNDIGYSLHPQSRTESMTVDWKWCLGELPAGNYKFQKQISLWRSPGDFDTFVFSQEFMIP